MGTRATITVIDRFSSLHIYLHQDGEPSSVISKIEKAAQYAWKLPRFEAGDFAAAIVKVMKKGAGHIYLTEAAHCHVNVSYHYTVSKQEGSLNIEIEDFKNNRPT